MGKLALTGGKPVRSKRAAWPQWPQHGRDEVKLMRKIIESNRWSYDGPYETEFARAFADYHHSKYGSCCANGTVGIQIALEALDIGAGDEVIVPGMTWQATAAAALDINATPILADVESDTWCLDLKAVEAAITPRTKAVITVHLYGCMADMDDLKKLCKKHKLYLVEDCAHQHGGFWKGKGVGALGDVSSFSFQESKVLSSGEGGFNMTQTKRIHERLYSLRNCGRPMNGNMKDTMQSGNYRITEFQAAMLLGGLKRLDKQVKLRDKNAQYLNSRLEQIPGILPMRRRKEITQASYFNFAFRLDWQALGVEGISNHEFGAALLFELQAGFERPYEPLNNCGLYKPHTKRRYTEVSPQFKKEIDPSRFSLPVCEDAHYKSGLVVHHHVMLGTRRDMNDIANAVEKVVDNIGELKKAPKVALSRYTALVG